MIIDPRLDSQVKSTDRGSHKRLRIAQSPRGQSADQESVDQGPDQEKALRVLRGETPVATEFALGL